MKLPRRFAWLPQAPLVLAMILSALVLSAVAVSAFTSTHHGIPASAPPLGNLVDTLRSYLFRNAVRNTLTVVSITALSVYILARSVVPAKLPFSSRWRALYAVLLAPLFLPAPLASFLWQPLLDNIDLIRQPSRGLIALSAIQVWRLWPLTVCLTLFSIPISQRRSAAVATLIAAWIVLIDVGTPLLATGGEPFNNTHLWSTWAFHTVWVSRMWGYGAVMAGGLAAASAIFGAAVWLVASKTVQPPIRTPHVRRGKRFAFTAIPVTVVPLLISAFWLLSTQETRSYSISILHGYIVWLTNAILAILVTTLVALLISAGHRYAMRLRLFLLTTALGMATVPAWTWFSVRWDNPVDGAAGLFVPAAFAGIGAGLLSLWPVSAAGCGVADRRRHALTIILPVAALISANNFAQEIALSGGRRWNTLGAGLVLDLAGDAAFASQLMLATATTFMLIGVAIYFFLAKSTKPTCR